MSADDQAGPVVAALNRHGYALPYAVVKAVRTMGGPARTWRSDGTEFPVDVNGQNMHVDLLLRSPRGLLVCECKRVDPVFGAWCFARSALATNFDNEGQTIINETITHDDPNRAYVRRPRSQIYSERQNNVGLEVKTQEKGEPQGTTRGGLEIAITQALKGVSGITNAIAKQKMLMDGAPSLTLIPVIFTTAKLVTCETDLSMADLANGRLPENAQIADTPWLWFRRASTPALRHEVVLKFPDDRSEFHGFNDVLNAMLVRSIGIVSLASEGGLAQFLDAATAHVGDSFG